MEKAKENVTTTVEVQTEEPRIGTDLQKEKIRNLVKGVYDLQKLRIATGNRVVQSFNIQMGQAPSTKQDDMEEEAQSLIKTLREEYRRITDAYLEGSFTYKEKSGRDTVEKTIEVKKNSKIDNVIKQLTSNEEAGITLIRSKVDYELMGTYVDLLETEERMLKIITKEVEAHPLWDKFFKDVKGCGPLMSAVCISYFDVHKARHASSFWKYAGLDTVAVVDEEGNEVREGRSRKHTEMVDYTDKDGNIKQKRGLTYNPELKTKLIGVLGTSFLRAGSKDNKYENIYRDYKNRLENRVDAQDLTKAHKNNMAVRYMVKQFVRDLWVTWRALEGYEVSEPYEVAFLKRKPHKYNEYHDRVAKETARK